MGIVRILFSLYGRIGRTTYVALIVLNIVASAGLHLAFGTDPRSGDDLSPALLAVSLVLSYIGIAAAVKRFHDRDKSGWWLVLPIALFLAAGALAFGQGATDAAEATANGGVLVLVLAGLGIVTSFWQAIELLFLGPVGAGDGTVNRYGARIALFDDAEPAPSAPDAEPSFRRAAPPLPEPVRAVRRIPPPLPGGAKSFGRRGVT